MEDGSGSVPSGFWSEPVNYDDRTLDNAIEEALAVIGPLCEGTNEM